MPLYEYECSACRGRFEKIQKFSDAPLEVCEKCGKGPVRKLMSSPAIQFKGTGWYITDYARSSSNGSGGKSSGNGASDSSKSDTKSETTSESRSESSPKSDAAAPARS